ncbi:MAG: hypothetical protein D3908_03105 [Candidatus Electrothrix sp. AUS4]|nr:hypothetical protein [Candidatus Electrothrix sp. AUS4]
MKQDKNRIKQSLNDSFKALGNVIKEAYLLAPFAVIVLGLIAITIVWVTLHWESLMMGTAALLVVFVSLCIFGARDNFGEAMLSLIGGLLTLFALVWTPGRYITFMAAWMGFAFAALLISSIKLAAKNEEIYRMASLRLADHPEDHGAIEKQLRGIGTSSKLKMLSPIERAEIIRVLSFRKLPIRYFESCLNAVETLSIITKCDIKTIALFFADALLSFSPESEIGAQRLVDTLYDIIKDVPVPPEEFFRSFESCRRLLISHTIAPERFFEGLRDCLESGISPNDMYDEMAVRFRI